jgi:hypothetical protein
MSAAGFIHIGRSTNARIAEHYRLAAEAGDLDDVPPLARPAGYRHGKVACYGPI